VSLTVRVEQLATGIVELSPVGEMDLETAHEVRDAINAVLNAQRPTEIQLNMRAVKFIDSVGISVLVAGFQAANVSGARLSVTQPSANVHRQLYVTGLHGLFGAPEPALA